jgi:hypothetical protein
MEITHRLKPLMVPVTRRILSAAEPEIDILQPEEIETVRPPALLPGMLDRVTGTDEHSTLSYHLDVARATVVTHAPVLRHTYRNALVRRTGFATWRHSERYGDGLQLKELMGPILHVQDLRYCHNYVNWRYFGHWLTDGIPSALIDPDQGTLWMPPHPDWSDASDYLDVFGLTIPKAPVVHTDRLTLYQDFGQGSHKRQRYAQIRDVLHARFGEGDPEDFIYLKRGKTGVQREIANEAELVDQLTARNWQVIDIATTDVTELQRALCRARIVVSIDGSHIDHAHLSLRPGATMVVLMPQDRFSTRQVGLCRAHCVSIGMVVLAGGQAQGYTADLEEILRTIDLAEASSQP